MAGLLGLRTPYALFIIALMVLGIVAGIYFYGYNVGNQNPCGDPGPAQFGQVYDTTVNGQPFKAVTANFTGTQQTLSISNVQFVSTAFNDPSIPHLLNGQCVGDSSTPATITVRVTFTNTGLQEPLTLAYKDGSTNVQIFTSNNQAGLQWNYGPSLLLLVSG